MNGLQLVTWCLFPSFLTLTLAATVTAHDQKNLDPPPNCIGLFEHVSLKDYRHAIRLTALNERSLVKAHAALMKHFDAIESLPTALKHSKVFNDEMKRLFFYFGAAVLDYIHGLDHLIATDVANFMDVIKAKQFSEVTQLYRAIVQAAEDPVIARPFAMARFIAKKAPPVESFFLNLGEKLHGLGDLQFPGAVHRGRFVGSPREAEMVRVALQYAPLTRESQILQIGYQTPAALLALSYFTRAQGLLGIGPLAIAEKTNEILEPARVQLLRGGLDDTLVHGAVTVQAPYSLIFALESMSQHDGAGRLDPEGYLRQLGDLLEDGGVLLVVNDYGEEPVFSQAQAMRAGFNVVRWKESRPLAPELRRLLAYNPVEHEAGQLAVYLLRKGSPRKNHLNETFRLTEKWPIK